MRFELFLKKNKQKLQGLASKRIYLISDYPGFRLLHDGPPPGRFSEGEFETLSCILNSDILESLIGPVLIDTAKAVRIAAETEGEDSLRSALLYSRICLTGTDGMRGRVETDYSGNCIEALTRFGVMTPELIKLASFSFTRMLTELDRLPEDEPICVCSDGRDVSTGGRLTEAMISGFHTARRVVRDIGIAPSPAVPFEMLRSGYSAGAVLTASHNPANQNGIKFFFEGRKLLPEGPCGDYALSAWILDSYLKGLPLGESGETIEGTIDAAFTKMMRYALPGDLGRMLKGTLIILDHANGAFSRTAEDLLDQMNLSYQCINAKPDGFNINRRCGVAEIEGTVEYPADRRGVAPAVVAELFRRGRERREKSFAIALDGDGDRGFVLFYDRENDCVQVLDGDRCGYIVAGYLLDCGRGTSLDPVMLLTVESDIMAARYAAENYGIEVKTVSVGDKWISNYSGGNLLLGLESSGHIIFPVRIQDEVNTTPDLITGNGLLTALTTLAAIARLKLPDGKIAHPYPAGFSRTYYTYFVDRGLFYRGSEIWNEDRRIIARMFREIREASGELEKADLTFEDMEDVHMLYASVRNGGSLLGSIFCRNSGTEDKTAVYIKCSRELRGQLEPIGQSLSVNHSRMKPAGKMENRFCKRIMEVLMASGSKDADALKIDCSENLQPIGDSDFNAILYALKKENRIGIENNTIKAKESFNA